MQSRPAVDTMLVPRLIDFEMHLSDNAVANEQSVLT